MALIPRRVGALSDDEAAPVASRVLVATFSKDAQRVMFFQGANAPGVPDRGSRVEDMPLAPMKAAAKRQEAKRQAAPRKRPAAAEAPIDTIEDRSVEDATVTNIGDREPGSKAKAKPAAKSAGGKARAKKAKTVDAATVEPTVAMASSGERASSSDKTDDKFILMKYLTHGISGTCAVREKGGKQFMEINIPGADLSHNEEVARVLCSELNKGVAAESVRQLAATLKEAMSKRIAASKSAAK